MVPSDQLQRVFLESASEVLETMCFVAVLGDQKEAVHADLVSAELTFKGDPSGRFGVQVPAATGSIIASNFLGKEAEDVTGAEVEQVVGELANMICGSVLSRIEGAARFELSHPVIVPAGESTPYPQAIRSTLELEEGFINIWSLLGETVPVVPASSAA